ncbi:glycosyltransferase [filamentous cyanobacterium LEGE 11480]|uniref:Glycosyltransferase n=1 Tax=Romeriopsis navalis LEGE 11480 TaxID=2777977 RepID=A0A928VJJ9_9CYAN|nr:glycosyltransferase family 2 protein [Romeriopsis navalis]MBE9029803.1 glycosyltransferase [Romeriopsis navalis LEGE 11480]
MTSILLHSPTSFSGNHQSRLKRNTLLFRYFAEINLVLGVWYLHWRIFHSLNFQALWLAVPLLIAEVYSYFSGLLFVIGLWRPIERQTQSLDALMPSLPLADYPTIDVFVTCYNEPLEIIEQTTRAALKLRYPIDKLRVYVLDDGNSVAVQDLVHRINRELKQSRSMQNWKQRLLKKLTDDKMQLHQLESLADDLPPIEELLAQAPVGPQAQPASTLIYVIEQLLKASSQSEQTLSAQLQRQKQQLIESIAQTEQALQNMQRCRYIARPKPRDRAHHAKAGNINYALFCGDTDGEFIITLDADHVLKAQFLQRVLPYFFTFNLEFGKYISNRVAFVQTPQDFHNLPADDPFGHGAHLFYGPIQQGKDGLNAAFYTGTNAILRREALMSVGIKKFSRKLRRNHEYLEEFELIGALATNSITEDMNTAMHLHANGWQSVYHHELLAEGLAPDDLGATLKQRLRWAQGTIQVLLRDNPLTLKGLTLWQRLQYFQTMYSYFSGFATLVYLIAPLVYFFAGTSAVEVAGASFALHFLPVFLCNRVTFLIAAWGIPLREIWRAEQYAIALFPVFIQAVLSVITGQSLSFQVTPKQRQSGVYVKLVIPQLVIFCLTLGGILWSGYRFTQGQLANPWVYGINSLWGFYNVCVLWSILRAAIWQPPTPPPKPSTKVASRSLTRV